MIQIDDKIISLDLLDEYFQCDLSACKGICCVDGDSGAPLKENEIEQIEQNFNIVKKYLSKEELDEIKKQGLYEIDEDGDAVTPCINGGKCVYLTKKDGIYMCVFEIAYRKGEIDFLKPISCHLYPIRVTKYMDFTAVNYEQRDICNAARILGKNNNVKVYEFLKEPIIRSYGKDWYNQLDVASKLYETQKK